MKRCCLLFVIAFSVIVPAQDARVSSPTVIRAGTLIDGKSDKPFRDQIIVIRGNKIESVSAAGSAKIPPDAKIIDLSEKTVLPGLID